MSISISGGTVSHLDRITSVNTVETGTKRGLVKTTHTYSFRMDNHPATYRFATDVHLGNGDVITAAGEQKGGTFAVWCFRNESTSVIYYCLARRVLILSAIMFVVGLCTLKLLIGLLIVPIGIYFFWLGLKMAKANRMLRNAPAPAETAAPPQLQQPPPPPGRSAASNLPAEIYLSRDGQQFGPYPPEQLRALLTAGNVMPSDLAWHSGITDWVPLSSLLG